MNLLLLQAEDLIDENHASVRGRRLEHIVKVIKPAPGDTLKAGLLNGNTGTATVVALESDRLRLELVLNQAPEPPLPLVLLLALPRPKMLRRILQTVATMGVERLYLINSYRVEKSYWQSPLLKAGAIEEQLLLGLEQAGTTGMPKVMLRQRFKPFVEDELESIATAKGRFVAHPGAGAPLPVAFNAQATIAIGPEGGFIPYEVGKLEAHGFQAANLGKRILTVETAISATISRMYT